MSFPSKAATSSRPTTLSVPRVSCHVCTQRRHNVVAVVFAWSVIGRRGVGARNKHEKKTYNHNGGQHCHADDCTVRRRADCSVVHDERLPVVIIQAGYVEVAIVIVVVVVCP
jgi:hypothetical protein